MLIIKRTYKKKYVIGGAGIFASIGNMFARMFSSIAANQLASAALETTKNCSKVAKKLSTPKSQMANVMVPPEEITKKVNEVIA